MFIFLGQKKGRQQAVQDLHCQQTTEFYEKDNQYLWLSGMHVSMCTMTV
jgi:hypothetical protein